MIWVSGMRAVAALLFLTALLTSTTGCFWRKPKPLKPGVATPPQPKPLPTVSPAPPPPKIDPPPTGNPPAVSTNLPEPAKPPQPKQSTRRTRRTVNPPKPTGDPGTTGQENAPRTSTVPKLDEFLTEAQRADLLKQCDEVSARARGSLDKLKGRTLDAASNESVERVRVFLQQAEMAKERDPQTALQLAQRADVLAADVLKSLK
jgi:hypothetical protein